MNTNPKNKYNLDTFFKHPLIIVIVISIITAFFAFQIPRAELDNNNIRFVPEDDKARLTSAFIDNTFGSSVFILVGLEREYGDVFDPVFLNRIRGFVSRMEEIEITGTVTSLVSADYISGDKDIVRVEKLLSEDFSASPAEIAELKQKILSWDMYRRSLVSDDFTSTQILVPLDLSDEEASRPEAIDSFILIRDIAREMFAGHAKVYVTGIPIISATINEAMQTDLKVMIPLVFLVVVLVLFFSFHRLSAVLLPVLTVAVAVIWSIGAMPLFGIKLSVISTVLPVILAAVGSAYGIHVVTHYLEDVNLKEEISKDKHREIILTLLRKIGKAVFLAALTTFAGFVSFCFTSVLPIREFGFFASFGVLASFIVAVTLIPALLLLRGPRHKAVFDTSAETPPGTKAEAFPPAKGGGLERGAANFFFAISKKRGAVIFCAAALVLVSIYGISKVIIDNVFIEYFKTTTDISRSDRFIREKFGGSKIVSVAATADSAETLLMPASLLAMDGLASYLEKNVSEVGKVMGFTDLVKRMNQVLNVAESPEGIKPTQDDGALYKGDSFWDLAFSGEGFDDFGSFGTFTNDDLTAVTEADTSDAETKGREEKSFTAVELIELLNKAASSGGNRTMDAGELVRQAERLLNYRGAAYYEIPADPARYGKSSPEELQKLVSNYLFLLSGDIDAYANDGLEPTAIKSVVQLKTLGDDDTSRAVNAINKYIAANFPPEIKTAVGGSALVESSLNRLVVQSQLSSVIISILIVFLIVALSNKSAIAGIIGIAPLSITIVINFAVMGFLGIKLNLGTSMVASVSVGIGIDYTIHYMEAYKREYLTGGVAGDFLRRTFTVSGKAILINAISVGAGFAVLAFSQFVMLKDLGILIALTMATSAIISLTVIPALLSLVKPNFIYKEISND
jgi:predicted RND superfamily exporter protein